MYGNYMYTEYFGYIEMTPDLGKPNTSNVFLYWKMCFIIGECVSLVENARDLEQCRLIEQKECFQSNLTLLLREIVI